MVYWGREETTRSHWSKPINDRKSNRNDNEAPSVDIYVQINMDS